MELNISEGCPVDINRSDGRVHAAFIYNIDWSNRVVSVHWLEKGESRGKDVSMDLIAAMNPDLVISQPSQNQELLETTFNQIPECATPKTIESSANLNNTRGRIGPSTGSGIPRKVKYTRMNIGFNNNSVSNTTIRNENVPPMHANTGCKQIPPRNTGRRKSNVVKEVEKLQKNREERRIRQAEEKAEKEAFIQQSPNNQYWEFVKKMKEYQQSIDYQPLTIDDPVEDHQITVCVRKRPLNKREQNRNEIDVITVHKKDTIIIHEPKNKVDLTRYLENQFFRFDYTFNENCTNDLVYKFTAQPLVKTIFDGGMATCFAYGQTGSGKTHTMAGDFIGKNQEYDKGIYALVAKDIFDYLEDPKYKPMKFNVSASFFEIYSGKVFDLLANKTKLRILEDARQQIQVVGLTEKIVENRSDVLKLIQRGNMARTSGQTSANANSSRSHAVFQLALRTPGLTKIHGKFSLIDLAGNERGADTASASRIVRMEGAEINKSLLALKECIRALGKKGSHLPFRASKLTQVLRDSFIGEKSKTCMIATISPGIFSVEHTLNTLRYADRVKELNANEPEMLHSVNNESNEVMNLEESNNDANNIDFEKQTPSDEYISPEYLKINDALAEIQACEEELLDHHKTVNEFLKLALMTSNQLYTMANNVEYDQEIYCRQWEYLLSEAISIFNITKNKVNEFRNKLLAEEQLSLMIKR